MTDKQTPNNGGMRPSVTIAALAQTFSPRRVDNIRKGVGVDGCTQEYFAELLGIPTITYRNWEQGRKKPTGPARTLLRLVEHAPEEMAKLLKEINSRA